MRTRKGSERAFTLIELLVVVSVIVLLTGLAVPAFNSIRGDGNFSSEIYNIAGSLEQARSYATSNNTYVLAGIFEASASQNTSATPQTSGTGRVILAVVASRSGLRPYNISSAPNLATWATSGYGTGGAFIPVGPILQCPNLHLVDLQNSGSQPPTSGKMARPVIPLPSTASASPNLSYPGSAAANPFGWPLGVAFSSAQYTFTKVIEFDPQGSARIISASLLDALPQEVELGLESTSGGAAAGLSLQPGQWPDRRDPDRWSERGRPHLQAVKQSAETIKGARISAAFTLIEVTLAVGIASFCLITVLCLLPMGITTNQNASEQTAAANIATSISADFRNTPLVGGTTSRFRFQIPTLSGSAPSLAASGTSPQTLYFSLDENSSGTVGTGAIATSDPPPRYRATVTVTLDNPKSKLMKVWIFITWPALADATAASFPANFSGSFETVTALDCN